MEPQQQEDGIGDTVNAAAIVLAAAARSTTTGLLRQRHQQLDDHDHASCTATRKTRWWSRLKAKLMWFRPHGHPQRIADASAEPGAIRAEHEQAAASFGSYNYYTRQAPQPALAFVAPPSSPASSVLTSESPSPVVVLNGNMMSSHSSPTASIFAIGPYAREPQQLVSPPAFSAGLTEPSTAPLTPPPESGLHLLATTTPSSPEVPFARFLSPPVAPHQQPATEGYFLYQLQPGSPILLSPGSTSSSPPFWMMQHWEPITEDGVHGSSVMRMQQDDVHDDDGEVTTAGGEFVFGSNADAAAGGEGGGAGGGGSLALGDATEQWPFLLAQRRSSS